mgnify:CR=1 FL=1
MPGLHSQLGPSSAHRYRRCAGSVRMTKDLPNTAGIAAAEGTVFHEFAALTLEFGLNQYDFIGAKMDVDQFKGLEFTNEMAVKMQAGLDLLESLTAPGAILYVEQKLDLTFWLGPDEFGTSDACLVDVANRRIIVFDWKWGAGVPVQPEWNDQGILYALGCWDTFAGELFERAMVEAEMYGEREDQFDTGDIEVWIVIEQPRAPGGGGIWKTTMIVLLEEGLKIQTDALATRDPEAPLIPGPKQCQFCAAAMHRTCPAERDLVLSKLDLTHEQLVADFDEVADMELPEAMDPKAVAQFLLHWDMIKKFHERLHAAAYAQAENGKPPPGMKLVDGRRPARAWMDEEKAEVVVEKIVGKDDAYTKKLMTPTQVEDWVGKAAYKKRFAHFVSQGEPKPQLVPDTDGRDPMPSRLARLDALMGDTEDSLL